MGQEKMTNAMAQTPDQITIGVDISKDRFDVHLLPDKIAGQFDNDRKGIARLVAWIRPRQPTRIIFEATGAYHRALEMALGKAGLPAVKIHPLQARRFAELVPAKAGGNRKTRQNRPGRCRYVGPLRRDHAAGNPTSSQ
jgi:transposase